MTGHPMSRDAFGSWLDAYGHAWETKDSQAFARLFAEDATYQVTPFEDPMLGRTAILGYVSEATRTQQQIRAHSPDGEMFGFPRLRALISEHAEEGRLEGLLLDELYSLR